MISKIVLLTISLFVALNLRKVESFIDSGYKFESFTEGEVTDDGTGEEGTGDGTGDATAELKAKELEEMKVRAVYSLVKLVAILVVISFLYTDYFGGDREGQSLAFYTQTNEWSPARSADIAWYITLLSLMMLLILTSMALTSKDMDSEAWKALTWVESLIDNFIDILSIYVIVKMALEPSDAVLKKATSIEESLGKVAKHLESNKRSVDEGGKAAERSRLSSDIDVNKDKPGADAFDQELDDRPSL